MTSSEPAAREHEHVVQFYDDQDALADTVSEFLGAALRSGGAALIVATEAHLRLFTARLAERGIDVEDPAMAGRVAFRDASEMLGTFYDDTGLDEPRFVDAVAGALDGLKSRSGPVRIYGEMVALLWDAGNVSAAIELEGFWKRLVCSPRHAFDLLCAYPARSALDPASVQAFRLICAEHTGLASGSSAGPDGRAEEIAQLVASDRPEILGAGGRALPAPQRQIGDEQLPALSVQLTEALRSGDGFGAGTVIRDAVLGCGHEPMTVISRVLAPAMHLIGELWERGEITVAEEHLASATCERLLAELYPLLLTHRPRSRERILISAVEGERHVLGARAAADILEGRGFEVIYLGADVPSATLGEAVRLHRPNLVALSLTRAAGRRRLDRAITAVQAAAPEVMLLLAGQGITADYGDLGFPVIQTTDSLIEQVETLLRVRPAMPRLWASRFVRSELVAANGPPPAIEEFAADFGRLARRQALTAHGHRLSALEDPLTRLPNRRAFDEAMRRTLASDIGATLLMADVDDFKRVNDTFGHEAGDRVLRDVGRALSAAVRPGDFVARIGGDEFAIILTDTPEPGSQAVAERIRLDVEQRLRSSGVTVSFGGSPLGPDRATYALADGALYRAKARGRNQLVM